MTTPVTFSLFAFCLAITNAYPSQHLQHIPVPGYDAKLQLLGQHVDLPEVPTKVIRITKTVAIKVPVPYPVKIPHNVPYPVHVNKPYPVPVPQIIKVPHPIPVPVSGGHHGGGLGHGIEGHGEATSHFQSHLPSYGGQQDVSSYGGHQDVSSYGGHQDLSSNGVGGGYGSSGYGEQLGGESQQVQSPLNYHQPSASGPTSYQSQQVSYHGSAPQSYSIDVDHSSFPHHKLGQDQQHSEASEQKVAYQPSSPGYQHVYQVEAPRQPPQVYEYKNQGY